MKRYLMAIDPKSLRLTQRRAPGGDRGKRLAAVAASPASANEIGTCRKDNLSKVGAGIDQLVSAASVGKRKGLVDNRFDLAAFDVRPDMLLEFIDDGRLVRGCARSQC